MKHNILCLFAALTLAVLITVACVSFGITDGILILALPFTFVGKGLRALSLSGSGGNVAAIVLYAVICLLPLLLKFRQKWSKKDLLLPVCSALLFYVMYYMINPAYRPTLLQNSAGDLAMAGAVYSVLLSWLILRFLDSFTAADTATVYSALRVFLVFCMAEFAVAIIVSASDWICSIQAIRAANTMPGQNLVPTYIFTFLSFAVTAAEYVLDILLLHLARKLLYQLQEDPYTEACCNASRHLSGWCKKYLILLTLSTAALNLLQLLFAARLYDLSVSFRLPLLSIALAFALLALTRLLYRSKELKEDYDLFI